MGISRSESLISVIIPTYNCDRYIVQAIDSVLTQENCEVEVIVIDDGSTDNTETVLEPYGDEIRYILQKNQGVAAARNHGIAQAKGNYVAFLDADDYCLPGKLAAQAEILDAKPDIGIVHSGWQRVDSEANKILDVRPWEDVPNLDLVGWLRWKPVLPSAMMFRREWLEYAGGFDPRFPPAEDTNLVLRMALKGCKTEWLREITVHYRQHEQSAMHKGLPQAKSLTAVMDDFFAQPDLPDKARLVEHTVRYGTNVWLGWYLYYTQHFSEMTDYLKKSLDYSPFSPIETVINWTESFAVFAANWGIEFNIYDLTQRTEWQELMQWLITEKGKL